VALECAHIETLAEDAADPAVGELLKEMVPQLARVALLFNPENISAAGYRRSIESVAKSLGAVPVSLSGAQRRRYRSGDWPLRTSGLLVPRGKQMYCERVNETMVCGGVYSFD
jgi:hypothetical protein